MSVSLVETTTVFVSVVADNCVIVTVVVVVVVAVAVEVDVTVSVSVVDDVATDVEVVVVVEGDATKQKTPMHTVVALVT